MTDLQQIQKLRNQGWTLQKIADKFHVSRQAVWLSTLAGKAYQKTDKYKAYQKTYQKKVMAIYQKYKDLEK